MVNLDDMLLEAAGRTSERGTKRNARNQSSKKRDRASHPGDGSGDDSDYGYNYPRRNQSSGSYIPVKKRSNNRDNDDPETEDEEDSHARSELMSDSSEESDVGSDLYKDEDDRKQLEQLTELERELILSDRASKKDDKKLLSDRVSKKDDKKLHRQMRSRWKSNDHQSQFVNHVSPPRMRSSTRFVDRSGAKADALNELRAKRMKQQESDTSARHRFSDDSSERAVFSTRQKGLLASSQSDGGSDSQSEDGGFIRDNNSHSSSDDEGFETESDLPTFDDVKSVTLRRSKLAKWFMEPFFEDLVVGCFVRVGIGVKSGKNVYRLCIVQNVDSSDPNCHYQLENRNTFKYLNCVWGHERSAARWQMSIVSDSPPSREEFDQWVKEVHRTGGHMPTRFDVVEKQEAIEKANSFVYSAETVKQMLREKKSTSRPVVNIAIEREKLRREMEIADHKNNEVEVERIKTQLAELEVARQSEETDQRALRLQEMNRKNRAENFKNASGSKKNQNLKVGEAGYDPFSRRWTRSTNYYAAKPEGGEAVSGPSANVAATTSQAEEKAGVDAEVAATEAALKEAAGAGKLVDTNAPVDQGGSQLNVLHEFELPISLAKLQRYGGQQRAVAAYMARRQKIEATIGCRAPQDDGRNHPFSLSVGDYKRRRGLL